MNTEQEFDDVIRIFKDFDESSTPNPSRQASARRNYLAHASRLKKERLARPGLFAKRTVVSVFRFAMAVLLVFVGLAGVLTGTAYAADPAMPGDLLYPVDLQVEEIQLRLVREPAQAVELSLSFAGERLSEAKELATLGREPQMLSALNGYQKIIASPQLANVKDAALNQQIVEALAVHESELRAVRSLVPVQNQIAFDRALGLVSAQIERHAHPMAEGEPQVASPTETLLPSLTPTSVSGTSVESLLIPGIGPGTLPYLMQEETIEYYNGSSPAPPPGLGGANPDAPGQSNPGQGNPDAPGQSNPGQGNPVPPGQSNPGQGNPVPPGLDNKPEKPEKPEKD